MGDSPVSKKSIIQVLTGRNKTAGGFLWKYREEVILGELWKGLDLGNTVISVSNKGRIRNNKGKILLARPGAEYHCVRIMGKDYKVHRLVASVWIPKPDELQIVVNHKDFNKLNNSVENLEWTTHSENALHAALRVQTSNTRWRKVIGTSLHSSEELTFDSYVQAESFLNLRAGKLHMTMQNKGKKIAGGYSWKLA